MTGSTEAIQRVLSEARVSTYLAASTDLDHALELYLWNAEISAAFMVPLHICEVALRNSVSDVLTSVYGEDWPRSPGFIRSLTNPRMGFNPTVELTTTAGRFPTTGKVIPELKFVFWQKLFTRRFDGRLWNLHLLEAFPHLDGGKGVHDHRGAMYGDLETIRKLRNRIAHHEPIFSRDIASDLDTICGLVAARCGETESWLRAHEKVTGLLDERP